MHVDGRQLRLDGKTCDTGLLDRFTTGRGDDVGVGAFAVAAELNPAAQPRMKREQCAGAGVVEQQCRGGDVPGLAIPFARVRACEHKSEHRLAQRVLRGIRWFPVA